MRAVLLLVVVALLSGDVQAQGGVLVREGNVYGEQGVTILNPLLCDEAACRRITSLLFPRLLNIDPATGWLAPPDASTLVDSWTLDSSTLTLRLRQGAVWSDGQPITAQDVVFSALAAMARGPYRPSVTRVLENAVVIDAETIRFTLVGGLCTAATALDFPVLPAHAFSSSNQLEVSRAWFGANSVVYRNHPFNATASISGGIFRPAERRFDEAIDLLTVDGSSAYRYVDVPSADVAVNRLLAGDLNLLVDPPFERRGDLRAHPDVQTITRQDSDSFFILLDLTQDDAASTQHPIFGDEAVRRALQMALDVPALMDATIEGEGTVLAAASAPALLGFNPSLIPVAYDPVGARRLLHEAGWRDTDGDRVRECVGCAGASGTRLTFSLSWSVDGRYTRVQSLLGALQAQFAAVGAEVVLSDNSSVPSGDAWLINTETLRSWGVSVNDLFRTGSTFNPTGYTNAALDRLYEEADTPALCDPPQQRGALYQEAQAILQRDQPALWLFSPNRLIAFRDNLDHFPDLWEVLTR